MYCEDVEISWNIRQRGYRIKYLYDVGITHYSYTEPDEFKVTQYIYMYINNLYLRCKYGSLKNSLKGLLLTSKAMFKNKASHALTDKEYKKVAHKMRVAFVKMIFPYLGARIYKHTHRTVGDFKPKFINLLDYEAPKVNPFNVEDNKKIKKNVLVSIIVRTCGRPNVLRETLISLRNQSYKNIEIVIVEDGKNVSEKMIKEEFKDLNILYKATGEHVGRSKVGNIAMGLAHGEYLNFLDDDDLFYYNHVETLVREAVNNDYDMVYDTAFETAISVESKDPYIYDIAYIAVVHSGLFSRMRLYTSNVFPIQTVMFKKKVFEECGGFDENMDALEDWDLWIKYSLKYDYHYVRTTTSVYRTPVNPDLSKERQKFIDSYLYYMMDKHINSKIQVSVADVFLDRNRL